MNRTHAPVIRRLSFVGAFCFLTTGVPSVGTAALAPQNSAWRSDLTQVTGPASITQNAFASLMEQYLILNDPTTLGAGVRDSTFIFQQCFGGGMISALNQRFGGGNLNFVAGSASQWNQKALGMFSTVENNAHITLRTGHGQQVPSQWVADPPQSFWTKQLVPGLQNAGQTIRASLDFAAANDERGVFVTAAKGKYEIGQSEWSNVPAFNGKTGDQIVMTDPDADNYVGIIWAGRPDASRHYTNVNRVYDTLAAAWPANKRNIVVLYGNGTATGTSNGQNTWTSQRGDYGTLDSVMKSLQTAGKFTKKTQFLFYATDHGDAAKVIIQPPERLKIMPQQVMPVNFTIEDEQLIAMQDDVGELYSPGTSLGTFTDYEPFIEVNYDSLNTESPVFFNGDFIGNLPASPSSTPAVAYLNLPTSQLESFSELSFTNSDLSTYFNLGDVTFNTGAMDDGPGQVPEPAAAGALMIVLTGARWRRRRSPGSTTSR